jgi:hypothetical protein
MTIQPIGDAGVALCLSAADLSPYGFSPSTLTLEQALSLIKDACRRAGIPLEGTVELELYPGQWGVMLFAHTGGEMPARPIPRRPLRRGRIRREPT